MKMRRNAALVRGKSEAICSYHRLDVEDWHHRCAPRQANLPDGRAVACDVVVPISHQRKRSNCENSLWNLNKAVRLPKRREGKKKKKKTAARVGGVT